MFLYPTGVKSALGGYFTGSKNNQASVGRLTELPDYLTG